ncbi:hypothetical protein GCM10009527_022300 [Actinomadura nitritigenes]
MPAPRERPDVVTTNDIEPQPPQMLPLRSRVSITEVEGTFPEQAAAVAATSARRAAPPMKGRAVKGRAQGG